MRDRRFWQYILLSYGLSWSIALVFTLAGGQWNSSNGVSVAVVYMYMPAAAALLLHLFADKEPAYGPLGISFKVNRWFLAAWLTPPILAIAAIGVEILFPQVSFSPGMEGMFQRYQSVLTPEQMEQMRRQIQTSPVHPFWLGLLEGLIAGITINAVAAFGEELGWRGYVFKLLKEQGFWRISLITGLIWGIWHAPLIAMGHNYPQHPYIGIPMMVAWCVLLAPIFTYVRIKSGSVIAASVLHGTINGTFVLSLLMVAGGDDLTVGMTGLAGFVTLIVANGLLALYDRFLGKNPLIGWTKKVEPVKSSSLSDPHTP